MQMKLWLDPECRAEILNHRISDGLVAARLVKMQFYFNGVDWLMFPPPNNLTDHRIIHV